MAKRTRKLNPDDARNLGRDIDDVVHESGSAIDAVYEEYKQTQRDLNHYEDIRENLRANKQSVPRELRTTIAGSKLRLRELDRRIVQHSKIMLRRIRERMDIIRNSPGASFNQEHIHDIDKAIFKVEQKAKKRGSDIRGDLGKVMGAVLTLEQDSGIVIRKPGKKVDEKSRRKSEEAEVFGKLVEEWKRVYKHAKKDTRAEVKEDIEWVTAQIRGLDVKFRRGESIRRGMERVAKRIKDIHNRTKPRKVLKTYADAKKGVRDFVVVIQEYSQGDVTSGGIDNLQRELETFSRQFTPKAKADWATADRRKFATDLRNLRKALEALRPKGRRKKNPCIGLHFHGKDTDELLKALEESAERQTKPKKNPEKAKSFSATQKKKLRLGWGELQPGFMVSQIIHEDPIRTLAVFLEGKKWGSFVVDQNLRPIKVVEEPKYTSAFSAAKAAEDIVLTKPAKKKPARKKTPPSTLLINRCQKLWDAYCEKPTKKNLRAVLEHLEKMKSSKSEKVKKERSRCLRVANKEAKRLKVK